MNTRLYSKWRDEFGEIVINYAECPAAYALMEHVRDNHCMVEYANVVNAVKEASDNPRVPVTKVLLGLCDRLNHCIGDPQNALLVGWVKYCSKAPHSLLQPPAWIRYEFSPHLKFCRNAQSFVDEEAQRIPTAMAFARKYDKLCPALPVPR